MPYHDRKSTRLNSSHGSISYAVFCLKKKKLGSNVPVVEMMDTILPWEDTDLRRAPTPCVLGREAPSGLRSEKGLLYVFFFFNNPAPPEFSPLPLPAALPISGGVFAVFLAGPRLPLAYKLQSVPSQE